MVPRIEAADVLVDWANLLAGVLGLRAPFPFATAMSFRSEEERPKNGN